MAGTTPEDIDVNAQLVLQVPLNAHTDGILSIM
jgi:hypothetical protein